MKANEEVETKEAGGGKVSKCPVYLIVMCYQGEYYGTSSIRVFFLWKLCNGRA